MNHHRRISLEQHIIYDLIVSVGQKIGRFG